MLSRQILRIVILFSLSQYHSFFSLGLPNRHNINALVHLLQFSKMKKKLQEHKGTNIAFLLLQLALYNLSCCYVMRTFFMYHHLAHNIEWYHPNGLLHILNQLPPQVALSIGVVATPCLRTSIKFCCDAGERAHIIKEEGKRS